MFALPLLALGTLWLLIEPISRTLLKDKVESDYRVELSLERYDLGSTLSSLSLGGLRLLGLDSREVLKVDSLEVKANLWEGIDDELVVDVDLTGLSLTLWREANGEWNLLELPRDKDEPASTPTKGPDPEGEGDSSGEGRRVYVNLAVRDSMVTVLGPENASGGRVELWRGSYAFETEVAIDRRGAVDVVLQQLALEAPFLTAQLVGGLGVEGQDDSRLVTLDGLRGLVEFSPVELAELVEAELPAQFEADARETVSFKLSGALQSFEWPALLDHLTGDLTLGVAGCTLEGFSLDGKLRTSVQDKRVRFTGEFESNEGNLALNGELLPTHPQASHEQPALRAVVSAEEVRAGENAAQLFSYIHPAFALVDDLEDSTVDGLISGDAQFTWGAPIDWEVLMAEEGEPDLTPLRGQGELAVNQVVVEGSSLLQKLREELDDDAEGELRLRPLRFKLSENRITYENPWTWTIGKTETSFEGSVGLDQTLDLSWNVPVTESLVDRYRFLRKLEGQQLAIPVCGTTEKPIVEYDGLIQSLGSSLLEDVLPGLTNGGLTGGNQTDQESGGAETPESLLQQADQLWDAERFTEAAALYARIRAEYKVSVVYALNRKRIKKRAKYQE